jgi:ATP-dependent DNA helicase RecG
MRVALDTSRVGELIATGESLSAEFKSERQSAMSDRDLYEAVVCLANASGGVLLLGVENDGTVTGAKPRHGVSTDPVRLQAAIFGNTAPPINTRVSTHVVEAKPVLAIEVDAYPEVCATKEGKVLRRVMGVNGPECMPFYPYEHPSRRGDLGLVDYSSQILEGAAWSDLDPLEVERLRQTIEARRGDAVLLSLDNEQLVQALRLVESRNSVLVPNVTGLLLLGREAALRRFLPAHEVAFQVFDARGNVLVNDWFHAPLLKTLEALEERFRARNQEQEIAVGLFRLPVPDYAPEAFREAINNALVHRDYSRLGTVHLQLHSDHLELTNPGGFLEGITLDNLLVHEPKPRNALLAEAFRRIGLVETTGRGIDKIYLGQLQYGRPLPEYGRSDRDAVRLTLRGGEASLAFAAFVYEQSRAGNPLTLDELITLDHLQIERWVDVSMVGRLTQRGESHARSVLERLVERGLVVARGERRERVYHLSASLYRRLGVPAGYVRTHGFDSIRQEAMVLQYVEAHQRITRGEAAELCDLTEGQASRLLRRMAKENKLRMSGARRGSYYERM